MSPDPVIQRARTRLTQIDAERVELERFLATYDRLAATSEQPHEDQSALTGQASAGKPDQPARQSSQTATVLDAVARALKESGAPMRLGALFDSLKKSGIEITGKNPSNNLGAMLSYSDRFETTRGIGWLNRLIPSSSQHSTPMTPRNA